MTPQHLKIADKIIWIGVVGIVVLLLAKGFSWLSTPSWGR